MAVELPDVEPVAAAGFTGEVAARYLPADPAALAREVARLADPGAAVKTLHWGRNYLYVTRFEAPEGPLDVVVKQFRGRDLRDRLRRRAGKAERSFRAARAMLAAGLATPEPVALLEAQRSDGPSLYVSRYLPDAIEARYLFRARNAGTLAETFPEVDFGAFVAALGRTLRRLHDAGFWHRDVSGGNILLPREQAAAPRDLFLLDLNRTRVLPRLSTSQRSRDLCRLALFRPEDQEALLRAYWGEALDQAKRRLYRGYHRAFLTKNEVKPKLRGAARRMRDLVLPRRAHAHIPPAPEGAAARDKAVWDRLSDQPHQHAGRFEKLAVRLADAPAHLGEAAVVAAALPRIRRRYRELAQDLHARPVPWDGVGICLRPWPDDPDALLAAVRELGVRRVLLRLHPWEDDHAAEEALASTLASEGYDLAFALPQSRELVRDPARWRAKVEELGGRFLPYGRRFQVGQAINRSKWGVWTLGEYADLAVAASEILRAQGDVEVWGPAVIDFEYHVTAAVLNKRRPGLRFDAVSSLLYVDRRGAPEGRQAGLDTVGKVILLKAIADTARNATGRCVVTEVNWPLWEGPHSPAGKSVSVDEETQADYLARYYLLALGTGLLEGVYWWQLVARGYGLIDPTAEGFRRRPSYRALATLARELEGARFEGPLEAPEGARLHRFTRPDGAEVVVGWAVSGSTEADLPRSAVEVVSRDGEPEPPPAGTRVRLTGSLRYFVAPAA